jgi:hypothetical protein
MKANTPFSALFIFLVATPLCGASVQADHLNYVIIVPDADWVGAFKPLENRLEAEWDVEGDHPWVVDELVMTDSTAIRATLISLYTDLQTQNGGDFFVLLVGDPGNTPAPSPRQIYDPAVAGYDLGWGEYVPHDDLYADLKDDGLLDVITFRLPAHTRAECEAYVAKDLAFRGIIESPSPYLRRVDILAEDFDRFGRSGILVRQHGEVIHELWSTRYEAYYTGDTAPYSYLAREATADSLDNIGHQIKITYGSEANRVNLINFQDLRGGWTMYHLLPSQLYYHHFALSCAHPAIDRPDNPNRALAELMLFSSDRGWHHFRVALNLKECACFAL